jgi:hypothetical protein
MSVQDLQLMCMALLCTAVALGCILVSRKPGIRLNEMFVTISCLLFLLAFFIGLELFGWAFALIYGSAVLVLLASALLTDNRLWPNRAGSVRAVESRQAATS